MIHSLIKKRVSINFSFTISFNHFIFTSKKMSQTLLIITLITFFVYCCFGSTTTNAAASSLLDLAKLKSTSLKERQTSSNTPTGNLTLIGDGFTWAENLFFDSQGGLFVNDDMQGILYKFTRASWTSPVIKQVWIKGFKRALGISPVYGHQPHQMYAVVNFEQSNCTSADGKSSNNNGAAIIAFDINTPNSYTIAVCTLVLGNGLAVNQMNTKGTIFAANEGSFIPNKGILFESDPRSEASRFIANNLQAADGVFLDQNTQLLYISEVLEGHIRIYNVSGTNVTGAPPVFVKSYSAPNCKMVDDFCIAYIQPNGSPSSTPFMFAADFWNDNVVAFNADGTGEGKILASGFYSPTSVRQGSGQGWDNPHSLFITEGGGFIPELQTNRRVWELHL